MHYAVACHLSARRRCEASPRRVMGCTACPRMPSGRRIGLFPNLCGRHVAVLRAICSTASIYRQHCYGTLVAVPVAAAGHVAGSISGGRPGAADVGEGVFLRLLRCIFRVRGTCYSDFFAKFASYINNIWPRAGLPSGSRRSAGRNRKNDNEGDGVRCIY